MAGLHRWTCCVLLMIATAAPQAWALPWQDARWQWVTADLTEEAPEPRTDNGVSMSGFAVDSTPCPDANEHMVSWEFWLRNDAGADRYTTVWAVFEDARGVQADVPLIATPAHPDGFGPSVERLVPADATVPFSGCVELPDGGSLVTLHLGARSAQEKLRELGQAVPGVAQHLSTAAASVDGERSRLALEVEVLRDEVGRLQGLLDETEGGSQDLPSVTRVIHIVQPSTPVPSPTKSERTLDRFMALYRTPDLVIATVPDPIDSPFAREFDLLLAAIRESAESLGYAFDHQYLPWAEAPERGAFRSEPGVMFFRGTDGARRETGLAVLLVGESPDRGVQAGALEAALERVRMAQPAPETVPNAETSRTPSQGSGASSDGRESTPVPRVTIGVIGPTFSGSRASLRATIGVWACQKSLSLNVDLRSGSASSLGNRDYFEDQRVLCGSDGKPRLGVIERAADEGDRPKCVHPVGGITGTGASFCYASWAVDDRRKWSVLRDHLVAQLGIAESKIVLLVESSLFGDTFIKVAEKGAEVAREEDKIEPELVRFPLHISQMHADLAASASGAASDEVASERFVRLQIDQDRPSRVRSLGRGLTSPSEALVLAAQLRELEELRFEAIGIIATDVRDKIFLAGQVRRFAPNARIFTVEGDALLAHPEVASETRGMIVASSRSLAIPSCRAKGREAQANRWRFANDWAHGSFLASRALFENRLGPSFVDPCPSIDESPFGRSVRLSVVGRGRLLDLETVVDPGGGTKSNETSSSGPSASVASTAARIVFDLTGGTALAAEDTKTSTGVGAASPPRGWALLVTTVMLIVATGLAYLLVRGVAGYSIDLRWSPPVTASAERQAFVGDVRCVVGLLLAMVALLLVVVTAPYLYLVSPSRSWVARLAVLKVPWTMAGALCGLALYLNIPVGEAIRTPGLSRWRLWMRPVAVVLAIAAVTWVFWRLQGFGPEFSAVLSRRALALSTNVSPLVPAILLVAPPLLWGLFTLARYRALHRLRELEPASRESPQGQRCDRLFTALDPLGAPTWTTAALLIFVVAVPALYLAMYHQQVDLRVLRSLESSQFDVAAGIFLILGLMIAVTAGHEAFQSWRCLRNILAADGEAFDDRSRYLRVAVGQIRRLVLLSALILTLLFAAMVTYPFQPHRLLMLYVGALLAAAAIGGGYLLMAIESSNAVREAEEHADTKWFLHRGLVQNLAMSTGLPIVGILATRFPGLRELLFDWVPAVLKILG